MNPGESSIRIRDAVVSLDGDCALGTKGEAFNACGGKPHFGRDSLAEVFVESSVVVSYDAWLENVRCGFRSLAVKPSPVLASEGHLRMGATEGPPSRMACHPRTRGPCSQEAQTPLKVCVSHLGQIAGPVLDDVSGFFWYELDGTGTVKADVRQRGKGVLTRATIKICDVRAYGGIIGEETHEMGTYDALRIRGGLDAHGRGHGGDPSGRVRT